MRRSIMVTALLSAAVLTSIVSPSYATPTEECWGVRLIGGNVSGGEKAYPIDERPLRLAGAERDDRGRATPPLLDRYQFPFIPPRVDQDEEGWSTFGDFRPEIYGPQDPGLQLALRLSSMELYVGISPAQLDVWRAFTSALISFLESPPQPLNASELDALLAPPDRGRPPHPTEDHKVVPLFAEALADGAIARTEKAKSLKEAISALRSTLSDEQLEKLMKVEGSFGPRPPFPGWMGLPGAR